MMPSINLKNILSNNYVKLVVPISVLNTFTDIIRSATNVGLYELLRINT